MHPSTGHAEATQDWVAFSALNATQFRALRTGGSPDRRVPPPVWLLSPPLGGADERVQRFRVAVVNHDEHEGCEEAGRADYDDDEPRGSIELPASALEAAGCATLTIW